METRKQRLLYIDNLRLLMIIFVVLMHLAVTYSGYGSWYYKEGKPIGLVSQFLFGFSQSFTQGYFMGFLFLISGFFVPGAYDRKGLGKFLKDRIIRLGIPTLIYMLFVNPFIIYILLDWGIPKPGLINYYSDYISKFSFIDGSGPLWFAFALLIFSFLYGLVRRITSKFSVKSQIGVHKSNIDTRKVIVLIILVSVLAFLIRLVQPIGTSFHNMQLCYFSQYIILFIVGIYAYRNDLFAKIKYNFGIRWFWGGLIAGLLVWMDIMLIGGGAGGNIKPYNGGLYWQSAAYALWESFVGISMSIGLLALFKEKFNYQNRLIKVMSDNSFAVYVFHAPIIIMAAKLFIPLDILPAFKFVILSVLCIPVCFVFTNYLVRKTPLLKNVM
ncbi:MAG: acyltransferase family protein [Bacillota bacterium]|nr:acyltransferase family protein [Bacillota bacterium]